MSDAVKLALVNQLPAILAGIAAIIAAVVGVLNRSKLQDVAHSVDGLLNARVTAATDSGRIQERTEQRQADKDTAAKP